MGRRPIGGITEPLFWVDLTGKLNRLAWRSAIGGPMPEFAKLALLVSDSDKAQAAKAEFEASHEWCPVDEAEAIVVLGGDGFMLQTLHSMLETRDILPVYGVNLGTVGFLMNKNRGAEKLLGRIKRSKAIRIAPVTLPMMIRSPYDLVDDNKGRLACPIQSCP